MQTFLLDTNAAIAYLNGKDDAFRRMFAEFESVRLPVIVLGELYFGAKKSSRVEENVRKINQLASLFPVVPCDQQTALIYATVRDGLRKKGYPIPEADMWIAAIAMQYGYFLITRDAHLHEQIDGLRTRSW
jgi:tRNA(fMet)-specific endonuclease VapC